MKLKVKIGDRVRFKKIAIAAIAYNTGLIGRVVNTCFVSPQQKSKYVLIQMDKMPIGYLTPMIYSQVDEYLEKIK